MKRKQFLALLLSASMLATSGVPVSAADVEPSGDPTSAYTAEVPTEEAAPSGTSGSVSTYNNEETSEDAVSQADTTTGQTTTDTTVTEDTTQDSTVTPDADVPSDKPVTPETDTAVETPEVDAPADESADTPEIDAPAKAPMKAPAATEKTEDESKIQTTAVDETEWPLTGDELQNGADFMVGADNFVGHYKIVDDTTVDMVYASLRYIDPEWPGDGTLDVTEVTVPATIEKDGKTYKVRKASFSSDVSFVWDTINLTFEEGITAVSDGGLRALRTMNLPSTLTSFNGLSDNLKDGTVAYILSNNQSYDVVFQGNDTLKYNAEKRVFYSTERGGGACDAVGDQFSQYTFKYEVVGDGTVDIIDMFESQVDDNVNITVPSQLTFKGKNFKVRNVVLDEYTSFDQCKQLRSLSFENGIEKFRLPTRGGMLSPETYSKIERINVPASMNIENAGGHPELKAFEVDAANPYMTSIDGVLFSKDKTELIGFPAAKGGDSYTVPASVKTLKDGSFMFAKDLQNLIVPSTVETMERGSLTCTLGVKNITIDHVEDMYSNLNDCYGTEVITIKGIEELPQGFISDNPDLKTINIEGNITYKGPYALTGNKALEAYNVKNASIISSKDGVLYNFGTIWSYPAGKKDETFVIPEDVYRISANAFNGTQHLKKLICPEGLEFSAASIYEPDTPIDVYLADQDTIHVKTMQDNVFISKVGGHVYAPTQAALDSILQHENKWMLNGMTAEIGFIPIESADAGVDSIVVNKGNTKELNLSINPTYATEPVQYEVTDGIASVSPDGVVTGLKVGKGTINIKTSAGVMDTVEISVKNPLSSMKFKEDTHTINKGDSKKLELNYNPEDADLSNLTFKSNKESVATVDKNGNVTAVGAGTATITAECDGITATCKVTVKVPLDSIAMSETAKTINKGENFDLDVKMNPTDATVSEDVKWTTSDKNVATVDKNGKVTAVGAGNATITATLEGKTTTCKVTVKVPLQSIELSEENVSMTEGSTKQLSVKYNPTDTTVEKKVTWKSSNNQIATVDANGKVTAKAVGIATITATVDGKTDTCKVTVKEKEIALDSIELSKESISLTEGGSDRLTVKYNPTNTTVDKTVSWKSNNNKVATVDKNGNVTAVGAGTATITATVAGKSDTCTVNVKAKEVALKSIALSAENVSLTEGGSKKLTVSYNPSNTTVDKTVSWKSSNNKVATVDQNGNVTAVGAGKATITATVAGKSDSCTVTVSRKEIALKSIELSADKVTLTEGENQSLSVKYNPTNTTVDKTVSWKSSNNGVVTVDKNGNIKAVGAGTATITATVAGKSDSCTVTVKQKSIPLNSISISEGNCSVDIKGSKQLHVTYNPSNTTDNRGVKWSSDNEFIATVDGNGVVTGLRAGTANITANVNGKTATITVTITVPQGALPFNDVNENDWFYNEVAEMYYSGTMTGTDYDTFAPYDPVARAQFAVIIYRLLGSPDVEFTQQYPDVGDDIWYTDAITYASNMGIITGYSDTGKFGPADNINREQLAVMLYRLCKATGRDTSARGDLSKFVDGGRVNDFAREAMEWAVGTGIISGKDGGTKCDPQGRASRAECAIMMSRFFRL